jgi:hypothetical protein
MYTQDITGGLAKTSKMPCPSYNLPATACKVGSRLRQIKNSVCSDCYACKHRYRFKRTQSTLHRRLEALNHPEWVIQMAKNINKTGTKYFRWHDSGDIQDENHLKNIFAVCRLTPDVKHWLPTLEIKTVLQVLQTTEKPPNLTIRVSTHLVDKVPNSYKFPRSMVYTKIPAANVFLCHATINHTSCKECRACWNENIKIIGYKKH